ncbi:YALI0E00660p [Yarrowia lipolytica CLIB122]|uniref:type I protein arginine methyltransferase n=2 Tax=Yarrowia lipolytica TaxID=4952 RepID=Q6C7I1_YARLI|nr:YALI0E00660p [Yarrowia lipolytica CLIB122]AOW04770.1 hypothetical protein YALI1_E01033g [Yarrowia lipolytica]KAB8282824.1 S-adenosyl-L-methionine-dependent methyltransferase [Yarrowia lipolytica]KAE8174547.1 S-adenosyl-L-methionine-dependent methyltransferase [Yarrowia lipolytica]KAJ8056353.1 S-adenosyl-L-methionine-dependent methyltransferase [Yarrowia lipolytica]QNP98700.1 Ribosomal protein arginine N-methyltransferase rmt3 [Yarrowia lipolytica]|eukprot:XP_503381.1 YALI0E00660p [Yarrowia lipolytica CLIB122]
MSDDEREIDITDLSVRDNELDFCDDASDDEYAGDVTCLFSEATFATTKELFEHMKEKYNFDWAEHKPKESIDQIKLVNYIRKHKEAPKAGETLSDEYMTPVLENDMLIMRLLEEDDDEEEKEVDPVERLQQENEFLKQKLIEANRLLASATDDSSANANKSTLSSYDTNYFDSYAHNEIHMQMLKDRVRTESYRDFFYHNKDKIKGKVVLDVGCGSGILSMFAAKAGARRVYGVDNSDIFEKTILNVKENGYDDVITLIRGKIEDISKNPAAFGITEKVDIIVSEWMGYGLLFESMLDSVLVARDALKPELMAPSQTTLVVCASDDTEYLDNVAYWDDVYEFKMTAMKPKNVESAKFVECPIEVYPKETVVSTFGVIRELELHTLTLGDLADFTSDFKIVMEKDADVTLLIVHFDTFFTVDRETHTIEKDSQTGSWPSQGTGISFSTGPHVTPTHWKAAGLPLQKKYPLKKGDVIEGTMRFKKGHENSRDLHIVLDTKVGGDDISKVYNISA